MTATTIYGFRIEGLPAIRWRQALDRARLGNRAEAVEILHDVLRGSPEFVPALVQAALLLHSLDRYREAEDLALRAARAVDMRPELAVEIGKLLRKFERSQELQSLFDRVEWGRESSAAVLVEAARLLVESGLYPPAIHLLDRAQRMQPSYAHQYYMRGSIEAAAGEADAAREHLSRAIELSPRSAHSHWMLSVLPPGASDDRVDLEALHRLLQETSAGSQARAYLAHALHNHLHREGRFDEAWEALETAMQTQRQRMPYRRDRQAALFADLEDIDLPALARHAEGVSDSPGLVFIVGMHRSGTSLLERVLAGHPQVEDGGETYTFTAQLRRACDHHCRQAIDSEIVARIRDVGLDEVRCGFRSYARWRAGGKRVLTEKLPSNFLNAGLIACAFPEARILHMQRDPVDTCFSNLRTLFTNADAYSNDPLDMADYFLRYRKLMDHWRTALPGRILDVDYAAFVEDPETHARRVLEFCGLDFDPAALDVRRSGGIVATASLGAVRRGILKDRGGAWRPYASQLQPMIRALEPACENGSAKAGSG